MAIGQNGRTLMNYAPINVNPVGGGGGGGVGGGVRAMSGDLIKK